MFYKKINEKVQCYLCPHNCIINNGKFGKCNVRTNKGGELFTINYGDITATALDPIEKKPLHFFKPSSHILSVGSYGCNMSCSFCQNYSIAHFSPHSEFTSKESLVEAALNTNNNIGIAFTYNEPVIWYEYVYDCAKLLKEKNKNAKVILVTNGFINEEPLKKLLPYIDAMNIDLKAFNNDYYKNICGGELDPILKTIEISSKYCHIEVTTLLVTGKNDNFNEIEEISKFLSHIDKNIPLHLTRYFPRYKMDNPATDLTFMMDAKNIANKYLNNVILGNI